MEPKPPVGADEVDREPTIARPWRIAIISAGILILELAFIRLIPAEVRAISYFTNLLFMAAFAGMGLGCILQRQRSLSWTLPVGMLLVFGFVMIGRGIVVYAESSEVHYWLQYELPDTALNLPLFPAAVSIFLFSALPFVAMGQQLAQAMDRHPKLVAYGWDIAGSFGGVVVFAAISLFGFPPWLVPPIVALIWAGFFVRGALRRSAFVLAGLPFLMLGYSPQHAVWSPYYFVKYEKSAGGLNVWVNSSFHQFAIDFTDDAPEQRKMQELMIRKWSGPYEFYKLVQGRPPSRVLILGAGTGNDVHVAVLNGAQDIVAVEIDPVILKLGRDHNPSQPYAHENVRTVVDDARHFLRTTDEHFDLIVFGTLDSQSLLSGYSNLRLDNYVYTREAFEDARRVLNEPGMVAVYYSVFKPWLYGRIYSTVKTAFGDNMLMRVNPNPVLFNTLIVGAKGIPDFRDDAEQVAKYGHSVVSTDDWPFVYLERPTISPLYLKVFGVVGLLIVGVFVLLRWLHPVRGFHANFFLLGVGFTLMESCAIVQLSLVFGSTWAVNAVVFGAVLLTVWLANQSVHSAIAPPLTICWIGLAAFVLINFFFPLPWLFELGTTARVIASGMLIGVPVYFAGVCFSRLFAREQITGYPLGINLIGAMCGGQIEYLSMAFGMKSIWLVVLMVYVLAWGSTLFAGRR